LQRLRRFFSEEDLTRFFQILLQTDDDLRRKPDPRVHLEMGLLRLINAGRLAPLEELLAELARRFGKRNLQCSGAERRFSCAGDSRKARNGQCGSSRSVFDHVTRDCSAEARIYFTTRICYSARAGA